MNLTAQFASKNLDATEKHTLGGASAVRAYPAGEGTGDSGFILSIESKTNVAKWSDSLPGLLLVGGFIDEGQVTVSQNPWTAGNNNINLGAFGLTAHWFKPENFVDVKASLAFKLGDAVAQSAPDADWRFWLTATKYF